MWNSFKWDGMHLKSRKEHQRRLFASKHFSEVVFRNNSIIFENWKYKQWTNFSSQKVCPFILERKYSSNFENKPHFGTKRYCQYFFTNWMFRTKLNSNDTCTSDRQISVLAPENFFGRRTTKWVVGILILLIVGGIIFWFYFLKKEHQDLLPLLQQTQSK